MLETIDRLNFGLVNSAHWNVFLSLKSWSFDFICPQDIVSFSNSIRSVKRFRMASIQTDGAGVSLNRSLDEVLAAKHPQLSEAKIGIGGSNPRKGLEIIRADEANSAIKNVAENCPNLKTLYAHFYHLKDDVVSGLLANCPNLKDICFYEISDLSRKGRLVP